MLKKGDYVTRRKYNNDIVFIVDDIKDNIVYLKGIDIRLYADSNKDDLVLTTINKKKEPNKIKDLNKKYFYIPGTILHLDSDNNYLEECTNFYKKNNIKYFAYSFNESEYERNINMLLTKHKPNILVITGHDAYYKKRKENKEYKNSGYYINTVIEARKIMPAHEELTIIAGACQSNFEGLIKSGATFASSPERINIHALDPAIIAVEIALTNKTNVIDIEAVLNKTNYGSSGIGGLITNGKMLVGYPRKE